MKTEEIEQELREWARREPVVKYENLILSAADIVAKHDELERENAELKESLGAISYASIKVQRENAELRNHEYAGELKAARDEVARLKDGLRKLAEDVAHWREENAELRGKLADALGQLDCVTLDCERWREKLATSERELKERGVDIQELTTALQIEREKLATAEREKDAVIIKYAGQANEFERQRNVEISRTEELRKQLAQARRKQSAINGCRNQMANAFNAQDAEAFWAADRRCNDLVEEWIPDHAMVLAQRDELREKLAGMEWELRDYKGDCLHFTNRIKEMVRREMQLEEERDTLAAATTWQPIETLDRTVMQFVLVWEDGAARTLLWNPRYACWERPDLGGVVHESSDCSRPTHWMKIPDMPEEDKTINTNEQ